MTAEPAMQVADIRPITEAVAVRQCFSLMVQLRPQMQSPDAWLIYWQRQSALGYRLAGLYLREQLHALAGYRIQENLVHGQYLYVDDLVTDGSSRSHGLGAAMMHFLRAEARRLACGKLVLDTPLSNQLGHRFYFRSGMLATSLRFVEPLSERIVAS